tara:strand:+ start:1988 stop:2326 length:339 start_codon:yes stop_codon:yes gene_type:complete
MTKLNYSSDNLTPNQKLQSIYHQINSGDDYYFIRHGLRAILWLKNNNYDLITSCDVWECLDNMKIHPNNPRSMGVVMKLAHKNSILQRTEHYKTSRRKQANQRPVRVWRLVK